MSEWFEEFGFAEVADDLLIGAYPLDAGDVHALEAQAISCVFNLCRDAEYGSGARAGVEAALARAGIRERRLETNDHGDLPPDALEEATDVVLAWLNEAERVYLHCRAGWQRSAAVAAGVIARREGIDVDEALRRLRTRRPAAEPLPHQLAALRRWWRMRSVREGA